MKTNEIVHNITINGVDDASQKIKVELTMHSDVMKKIMPHNFYKLYKMSEIQRLIKYTCGEIND